MGSCEDRSLLRVADPLPLTTLVRQLQQVPFTREVLLCLQRDAVPGPWWAMPSPGARATPTNPAVSSAITWGQLQEHSGLLEAPLPDLLPPETIEAQCLRLRTVADD